MSTATLILGQSGTGKSTSMRGLDPANVLLIQAVKKPLPFRAPNWTRWDRETHTGSVFVSDKAENILLAMKNIPKPIVILDDFQYVLANEFMRRSHEKGYDKFTEIGKNAWEILMLANRLEDSRRVYIMCHTDKSEDGGVKMKTIGKMLDDKITPEGLVTICLRTAILDGAYKFQTQNSGNDTTKSPMGLFPSQFIDNDLAAVDAAIVEYYGLGAAA